MTERFIRTGSPGASRSTGLSQDGFTLIELLVVCTLIGILMTIAVPTYQGSIVRAKEAALAEDLSQMRAAIDKFYGDTGRYPTELTELVEKKYIRSVPEDPFTLSSQTWNVVDAEDASGIYDVVSGSELVGKNGIPYSEW